MAYGRKHRRPALVQRIRYATAWITTVAAGGGAVIAEYRWLQEPLEVVPATGAIAFLLGVLWSIRIHARGKEKLITVQDLRRR